MVQVNSEKEKGAKNQLRINKFKESIRLKVGKSNHVFFFEDVHHIKAEMGYSIWQMADKKVLQRIALTDLYDSLKVFNFIRTHRKHIVNLNKIEKVNLKESNITLSNGDIIPISRRLKKDVIQTIRDHKL